MAKGAAYETSYCRRGLFGGRAYTSKEARYGAFGGCCPVHGGFKTQRMLRSRDFTGGSGASKEMYFADALHPR